MFKKLFGFGKKKEETQVDEVVSEVEKEEVKEDDERFLETLESEKEDTKDETKVEEVVVEEEISEQPESAEEASKEVDECEEINAVLDEEGVSIFEETVAEIEEKSVEKEVSEPVEEIVEAAEEVEEIITEESNNEGREKPAAKKEGLFARLKRGLTKAKQGITDRIDEVLKSYTSVDDELFEDLEEVLITADVGVNTTMQIIDDLNDRVRSKKITDPMAVREELKEIVEE
ncbi:MAG: signal recognition particle receptor subunit alpha, partial [Peptacetobacter hiranonis]|nr:signal recognition particle receptor subunit alpha [Peptacetobacter hiranonis]